jgi:predicted nucleotidyltransferase
MNREKLIALVKNTLALDKRIVFAYAYGSFILEKSYRDIDIGIFVKNPQENQFVTSSEIKTTLSRKAREANLKISADQFDVKILNDAPFTFLRKIFTEGILLTDRDPDRRTDLVEYVSLKYRECARLLVEASLI